MGKWNNGILQKTEVSFVFSCLQPESWIIKASSLLSRPNIGLMILQHELECPCSGSFLENAPKRV